MESYLSSHINGIACPGIYEMAKIGFPRTTCYAGDGVNCKFYADGECRICEGDWRRIRNRDQPVCTAGDWINRLSSEMTRFGAFGGTQDLLNHFLEDRLRSESTNLVSNFATRLFQSLTAILTNFAVHIGAEIPSISAEQVNFQSNIDMTFQTFFGQFMVLAKLAGSVSTLVGLQRVPTMKDITNLAGGMNVDAFDKSMISIDEKFAKLRRKMALDEEPITATISRKEVKRLRKRISVLEQRLNNTADSTPPVEAPSPRDESPKESSQESSRARVTS